MKRPNLTLLLAILPLFTILASYGGYRYILQVAPKPVAHVSPVQVEKEQQLAQAAGANSYFIGTSHYTAETSAKSKIQKTETGKLFKITKAGESTGFITATLSDYNPVVASGWTATQIGSDAMWIPGACAQKPSWMIGDHLILIDDGQYDGAKATHYYALYNTLTRQFSEFGGALANDTQAKEKILLVNVEAGKLVFYIDQQDASGPYVTSTSFKHSSANHDSYLLRRVIETPDLTYSDYRVPYTKPAFDDYHVSVAPQPQNPSANVLLSVTSEGGGEVIAGQVAPNTAVSLAPVAVATPSPGEVLNPNIAPYRAQIIAGLKLLKPGDTIDNLYGLSYFTASASGQYLAYTFPAYFDLASKILTQVIPGTDSSSTFTLGAQ